jgi:large subunit ribosomal protein L18
MSVSRSLKNVYVQLIDDEKGTTLLGVSSLSPDISGKTIEGGKSGLAKAVGELVADKAKAQGITEVVFDRSGFLYHGRVKAVAEGARKGGLLF